jgi:4-oxalmesaconate hydratase
MIIDCHGHYTTEPSALHAFRKAQLAGDASARAAAAVKVTDDELRATVKDAQLRIQHERGTDLTIFSPRASGMGHHLGDFATSLAWSQASNELIHRLARCIRATSPARASCRSRPACAPPTASAS